MLLVMIFGGQAFSQAPNPDCKTLLVTQLQMDSDTADLMKVTVKNTCSNCAAGINGCVYLEIEVIRTVAPFDTIASSNCFCHFHAPNGGQHTYQLFDSKVTALPPLNQIRVSIPYCGCDTIPYEAGLISGLSSAARPGAFSISRLSEQEYELKGPFIYAVAVKDITGKTLGITQAQSNRSRLDLGLYAPGLYLLEIRDKDANSLQVFKVLKS